MAKGLPWFRMYTDFLEDPKLISLAFEDQRHFIGVLALKSSGLIDQECTDQVKNRLVAQRLWIDYAIIGDVKKRLIDAGLIDKYWQPVAWDKRQFLSDHDPSGAERQRKHREKQRLAKRNALRNAQSNALVTPPDTDTDTDTDTEEKRKDIKPARKTRSMLETFKAFDYLVDNGVDGKVAADFIAIRKAKRSPLTETALSGIKREAEKAGYPLENALKECVIRGWQSFKAEWVNKPSTAKPNSKPSYDDGRKRDYGDGGLI